MTRAVGRAGLPGESHDLGHHGDVEARGAELDFAVNVIPGPPEFIREAMRAALENVAAYPDERPARDALAAHLGVDPESLLLVNGAAEAFTLIARMRPWCRPLVVHPQFTEPEAALLAAGRPPGRLVLGESEGFRLTPERVAAVGRADLVIVGNPTNPTSRLHDRSLVRALGGSDGAGRAAGGPAGDGRVLVVDEAFMDVVPDGGNAGGAGGSLQPVAPEEPRLLVLRSLTKTFALAGVRAGYVIGDPALVGRLREIQPPWSVNSIALAATRASITPEAQEYVDEVVGRLESWRPYLETGLTARGWSVVPKSSGPFLLARHPDASVLRETLRRNGIAIRRGDTFPGLNASWARFALRSPQMVDRLLGALDDALGGVGGDVVPNRADTGGGRH